MRIFIICFFAAFVFLQSCRLKESCEVNDTGEICIKNTTSNTISVYINGPKEFDLKANERICVSKPVGTHHVKCWQGLDDLLDTKVLVSECEQSEVTVR